MKWEKDIQKAFERNISPEPNAGCWLWTGGIFKKRNGCGAFVHRPSNTI